MLDLNQIPMDYRNGPRRMYAYPVNFVVSAGNQLAASGGEQQFNLVSEPAQITVFTHIGFTSTGNFLMQLIMSDLGGGLFKSPVSMDGMLSLMDKPGEFPYPIVILGQGSMLVQAINDNGAVANDVRINFIGYRIFKGQPGRNC